MSERDDEPEDIVPGLSEETIYDATPEPKPEFGLEKDLYPTEITTPKPMPVKGKRKFRPLRFVGACIVGFFAFSILSVAIHRFVPVPVTFLMIEKLAQGNGLDHRWVPAYQISDNLKRAVIASEDAKFCTHDGFDIQAIEKAERYNATHKKKRGASTISQQTAKNVFLWPDRSWIRKGFEVYYTFLIEHMWSKDRIMEVYLNSIEMGPGIYGAEAASQYWFGHSAATLSRSEAAQLAAILPNPVKRKAKGSKRSGRIAANARTVVSQGLDACAAE
jgi:monofunctional biosynthetic peptidoglycan transglycosylase